MKAPERSKYKTSVLSVDMDSKKKSLEIAARCKFDAQRRIKVLGWRKRNGMIHIVYVCVGVTLKRVATLYLI